MTVYRIRKVLEKDLVCISDMCERSFYDSHYLEYGTFNKDFVLDFCRKLIESKDLICFVGVDDNDNPIGFISGLVYQNFFNTEKMAYEQMWWVDEKHRNSSIGVRLFLAFEKKAEEMGASSIATGSAHNKYNLDRMYDKLGYKRVSSIHMRKI